MSFQDSTASICFKTNSSDTEQDCVLITNLGTADRVVQTQTTDEVLGSDLKLDGNTISSTSKCQVKLEVKDSSGSSYVSHNKFYGPHFSTKLAFLRHHVASSHSLKLF